MPIRLKTDLRHSSPVRCHTRPALPSRSRVTALRLIPRTRWPFSLASKHILSTGSQPVSPFVVACLRRGPPVAANESRLPCRVTREDFRPLFYLGHTPSPRRFNHLVDNQAPATTPAAADLPTLIKDFVKRVALLSDVTPRTPILWVRLSRRPSFRSFAILRMRAISGARTQKPPLTHKHWVFAVWHRLSFNSPASGCPPFMVELFTADDLRPTPNQSRPGSACCQVGSSPRRPRLNVPHKTETNPRCRITAHAAPSPALNLDALDQNIGRGFSASPSLGATLCIG